MPKTISFASVELRLLLALLRSALHDEARITVPTDSINWAAFIDLVERHRVGAFLHRRATLAIRDNCPVAVSERIRDISAFTARRALAHAAVQLTLVQAIDAIGVDVIAIKGLILSQRTYGAIGARHVGDIDLFVRGSDIEAVDMLLQSRGLRRTRPDFPLSPRQLKSYVRIKPEFEYHHQNANVRIELLWRLDGISETRDSVWSHSARCRIGGHDFRTLSPEIEALYLLQHGARHAWFRLFWLVDAAMILRNPAINWEKVATLARSRKIDRAVVQAAGLVEDLLGISPPKTLVGNRSSHHGGDYLRKEALRQIARPVATPEPVMEWTRQLVYRVRLQRSLRAKFGTMAPHLFTPESWRTLRLSDRWFALYYPLTPFLWIWRRLHRRNEPEVD